MKEKIIDILEKHYHGRNHIENRCAEELLDLFSVVGRSEQYHCELYDFGRWDKPCDKQCDECKAMNLD